MEDGRLGVYESTRVSDVVLFDVDVLNVVVMCEEKCDELNII